MAYYGCFWLENEAEFKPGGFFTEVGGYFSPAGELYRTPSVSTYTKPRAEVLNFTPLLLTSAPFFFIHSTTSMNAAFRRSFQRVGGPPPSRENRRLAERINSIGIIGTERTFDLTRRIYGQWILG
jgi:hypothetical protein